MNVHRKPLITTTAVDTTVLTTMSSSTDRFEIHEGIKGNKYICLQNVCSSHLFDYGAYCSSSEHDLIPSPHFLNICVLENNFIRLGIEGNCSARCLLTAQTRARERPFLNARIYLLKYMCISSSPWIAIAGWS